MVIIINIINALGKEKVANIQFICSSQSIDSLNDSHQKGSF